MTHDQLLAAADVEAADLALEAGPEALLAGAADEETGPVVLADLLAHEMAAGHRLMLRLSAASNAVLDWTLPDPETDTPEAAAEAAAGPLARLPTPPPRTWRRHGWPAAPGA